MRVITVQFFNSALHVVGARLYPLRETAESYGTGHVPGNAKFFGVTVKDTESDNPPMPMGNPIEAADKRIRIYNRAIDLAVIAGDVEAADEFREMLHLSRIERIQMGH